jgi:predicted ATPase/DNA-binding XRE family transcriptional regulator
MQDEARVGSPGFGVVLRRYRLAAGLSQEELAERARMSAQGISALERGFRRSPQRETLALLAGALALSAEERREFEGAARTVHRRPGIASVTVGPWPNAGAAALPLALSSYVGRRIELAEIAELIRNYRLVTLTGVGGIGKTQTGLRVAGALLESGEHPACFVGLQPISDPGRVAAAIAQAVGVQQVPDRPILDTLVAYLKNKKLLLILDNCEHVLESARSSAAAILSQCPDLRLLTTTRQPLKIAGERVYRIASLTLPSEGASPLTAAQAAAYDAVALFADRAREVDHRFTLSDENASAVATICRRLDGIPLAIELAAARTNVLSLAAISKKLGERFRVLTRGEEGSPERKDTMRAAIDWSYKLLSDAEQRLFENLSVFAGGATLPMAARVCGESIGSEDDVLDLLSALVDKSLVVADLERDEPRYLVLESFRQYAREKLVARGDAGTVQQRHAGAYLELAGELEDDSERERDDTWREMVVSEMDNWREALDWTLTARSDVLLGQQIAGAMNLVWFGFAPVEGRRWLYAAVEATTDRTPTLVLAAIDYARANVAMVLGEHKEQLVCAQAALSRYTLLGDEIGTARAKSRAGHALVYLSRMTEGMVLLEEALSSARRLRRPRLIAFILRSMGLANARSGDFLAARQYVSEAASIYEALNAKLAAAGAMDDLGEYEFLGGNGELAVAHATTMVALIREANAPPRSLAIALNGLAVYLIALARYDEGRERAREALELAIERELTVAAAHSLQHLAAIAALRPQSPITKVAGKDTEAARVLGFVDARLLAMGSERLLTEQQEYNRAHAALADAIGASALADAMATGATLTQESAVEVALRASDSLPPH